MRLTTQELEVLRLTAQDLSKKEIANKRNRSIHTIDAQTRSIKRKYGCHSLAAAIYRAIKVGYIL